MATTDAGILSKNELTIVIRDGRIVIEHGDRSRGGGNVLSDGGKKVSWNNATRGVCTLTFRKLLPDDEPGEGEVAWPFECDQDPCGNVRTLPKETRTGENPWDPKLKKADWMFYKYDVHVSMDDGTTYDLDPIIIVRT